MDLRAGYPPVEFRASRMGVPESAGIHLPPRFLVVQFAGDRAVREKWNRTREYFSAARRAGIRVSGLPHGAHSILVWRKRRGIASRLYCRVDRGGTPDCR